MKILLDEKESEIWIGILTRERIREETSRFPEQLPNGMLANWPSHHKEEIMALVAEGKYPREIAKMLNMKESSVKHLVYTEKKRARSYEKSKAELYDHRKPSPCDDVIGNPYITPKPILDFIEKASQKLADRGSTKPIVIAEESAESPAIGPISNLAPFPPLGNAGPKNHPNADNALPQTFHKTARQDRIDEIIIAMSRKGRKYSTIATEINNLMGGCFTSDHVAERLMALGGKL